ncbi:MAG: phenylacetate--CoA ligase family protein [Desulfobulbaceae bacterium]|nr:MAG: phenylacetate--CoA ligase family protein [Desulfobulbaceae bacterium]
MSGFFDRLRGNAVVFANARGQRRVPYLSRRQLETLRDKRVRDLVAYAAATVPFYRDLFRQKAIDPRAIRTAADLGVLPLLSREEVRADPRRFLSSSRQGRDAVAFVTSGTTGTPLTVFHDQHSLLANIAFGERERAVVTGACGRGFGYREMAIYYPGSTSGKVWDFYRRKTWIPVRPQRLVLSVLDPYEQVVAAVNRFRPDVLISYGSYLETLFRIVALQGKALHHPRLLIYTADAMSAEGRRFIGDTFAIPTVSHYNAVEAFKIGFVCEAGQGFHLHEDLCHVRIVDRAGNPVPDGQAGEVVITNLVNRGTVLLNYRLGDMASISGAACGCGRSLRLLSELDGRKEDVIFLPNGEFIHPRAIWGVLKSREEVIQGQLIQHEPLIFELRLVTGDRDAYRRVVDGIVSDLQRMLGRAAVIEHAFWPRIETAKGGKFRPVIALGAPRGLT